MAEGLRDEWPDAGTSRSSRPASVVSARRGKWFADLLHIFKGRGWPILEHANRTGRADAGGCKRSRTVFRRPCSARTVTGGAVVVLWLVQRSQHSTDSTGLHVAKARRSRRRGFRLIKLNPTAGMDTWIEANARVS